MALLSPAFVQGLAAAGFGQDFANKLAAQQQQLQSGALDLQQAKEKQQASNLWAKAMANLWASAPQQPGVTPPQAPQPGQPQVAGAPGPTTDVPAYARPQTAAQAAPVTTPQGAATAQTQQTQAAIKTVMDKLQAGQTPSADDMSAFSAAISAPPQGPQAPPPSQGFSPTDILKQIETDNPDLPPGVLSSIVDDHLMPMLSDEQKRQLDQAKMHLDFDKMNLEQQDKVNKLLLQFQAAIIKQNDWSAARADRLQAHQDTMGIKDVLVSVTQDRLAMEQQKAADEHQKAIDEHQKFVAEQNAKGPVKKLPPGLQANLTALQRRETGLRGELNSMTMIGHDDRRAVIQAQLDETVKQIDDLRAQAKKLDAQGAPTQPPSSQGSGNPATANIPQTPIPADTPPAGITPAQWATLVPEQKKAYQDYVDGIAAGGDATKLGQELEAKLAEIQKKLDKQKPLGQ